LQRRYHRPSITWNRRICQRVRHSTPLHAPQRSLPSLYGFRRISTWTQPRGFHKAPR
jgi:hypothetical protein